MTSAKLLYATISFNLALALIILLAMFGWDGLDFLVELPLNLVVGVAGLYLCGHYISKITADKIRTHPKYAPLVGIAALFLVLATGTFCGSTVGFIQEGISEMHRGYSLAEMIFDYYYKPFFWIFFIGVIPTLITGSIMGLLLKRNMER